MEIFDPALGASEPSGFKYIPQMACHPKLAYYSKPTYAEASVGILRFLK